MILLSWDNIHVLYDWRASTSEVTTLKYLHQQYWWYVFKKNEFCVQVLVYLCILITKCLWQFYFLNINVDVLRLKVDEQGYKTGNVGLRPMVNRLCTLSKSPDDDGLWLVQSQWDKESRVSWIQNLQQYSTIWLIYFDLIHLYLDILLFNNSYSIHNLGHISYLIDVWHMHTTNQVIK